MALRAIDRPLTVELIDVQAQHQRLLHCLLNRNLKKLFYESYCMSYFTFLRLD